MSFTQPSSARLVLVSGPPGSGKSHVALERVRAAATSVVPGGRAAARAGEALLLLPTYGEAQHALRMALTRWEARGVFDEVFVTFTSAGERFLPGFHVRSLPSAQERDRLLLEALRQVAAPVFSDVVETRGLRVRLLRLFKEVKQGAIPPAAAFAALAARAPELAPGPCERLTAALAVADAYGALLERAGLEDHEDALHRLLASLRAPASAWTPALLAVDGFDDMTPVEEAILEALIERMGKSGGEVLVTLPHDEARPGLYESAAGLRARLLGLGFSERRLTGFARAPGGALERLATNLFGAQSERVEAGDQVEARLALDSQDEADLVARIVRDLLAGAAAEGSPVRGARDVVVVVPDLERHGRRVEERLTALGVPVRLSGPRSLAAEPWVRAAAGVLPLLAGRMGPGEVDGSALLATLRYRALMGDARLTPATVDAQDMAWRRGGFPHSWTGLVRSASAGLAEALAQVARVSDGLAAPHATPALVVLAALDELVPVPAPAPLLDDGRCADPDHDRRVAQALAARQELGRLAADRAAAVGRVGSLPTPRALAGDLLEALPWAGLETPDRRLDVVHVLDVEGARSWEAAVVVVAGLDEDGPPRRPVEDPLLADEERERLAVAGTQALPTTAAHQARERRRLLALFTRARRRLILVRATRSPDGEVLPPSPLWGEVLRVLDLVERAEPAGSAPGVPSLGRARTRDDLLRWSAAAARRVVPSERAVAEALRARLQPDLAVRAARWRRREADPLPPSALARCRSAVERVSASLLNAALSCEQQHFLVRVAGVAGDTAPLSGPRFAASDLGSLLHAAFRLALLSPLHSPEEIAAEALGDQTFVGLPPRAVRGEIARAVSLLRDREAATAGPLTPVARWLEHRLGARGSGVELGSGVGRFVLEGQVDRLDLAGTQALVVDYKGGKSSPEEREKATAAGEDLQLPLYALAVEREAGYEVVGLEWVSSLRRARAHLASAAAGALVAPRMEDRKPQVLEPGLFRAVLAAAEARSSTLVERLRAGAHRLAPRDARTCTYCPVAEVCRPDRAYLERSAGADAAGVAGPPHPPSASPGVEP